MIFPYHLTYGVDVAISKLRPGARFTLHGTNFVEWNDPNGLEPPSWNEVMEQIKKDEHAANSWLETYKD